MVSLMHGCNHEEDEKCPNIEWFHKKNIICWFFWMTLQTLWSIFFKLEDCDFRLRLVDNIYILFGEAINVLSPVFTKRTISFTSKNSAFLPHGVFMCLVWVIDYFPILRSLIGFYNREELCLPRGTDWNLICNTE